MRARLIVVAGPSGSGKSRSFPREYFEGQGIDYFNIDDRLRELNGGSFDQVPQSLRDQANRDLNHFVDLHTIERKDMAFETTLRNDYAIRVAARVRQAGFDTDLRYLTPEDVSINIERVRIRTDAGGHSAPDWKLREIYQSSTANLPAAIRTFSTVDVVDNTRLNDLQVKLSAQDGQIIYLAEQIPAWLERSLEGTEYNIARVRDQLRNWNNFQTSR